MNSYACTWLCNDNNVMSLLLNDPTTNVRVTSVPVIVLFTGFFFIGRRDFKGNEKFDLQSILY